MSSKIICGPKEDAAFPSQSLGKTYYEELQKADQNAIAYINADNTNEFLTYGKILEFSQNLSINLRNFGIGTNDVIGIVAANSIHYNLVVIAGYYLGAPVHLINPHYTPYELRHLFKISNPKIVFCSQFCLENIKQVQTEFNFDKIVTFDEETEDSIKFEDLITKIDASKDRSFKILDNFDPKEHVAVMMNTSGTTGLPKVAMLTHECERNILTKRALHLFHFGQNSAGICVLPFCQGYGFQLGICVLLTQSKLIIVQKFKSEIFFELIQNYRAKKLVLVPTLISLMVHSTKASKFDLSSLEEVFSAASPLSAQLSELVYKKFKLKNLYEMYGSTEAGLVAISNSTKFTSNFSEGKLCPWKEVKIADPETNEALGAGKFGEICVRGGIFKGYLNNEEKTRQSFDDEGFFHTGDGGYCDEEGQLYLTDRIKDIIKYKSFQFSPVEVEEVLLHHPEIEDAAVIGKSDDHAGELAVAFVVKKQGSTIDESEIIKFVAKYLSAQKQLHGGVIFIQAIPRNYIGKILRHQLKQLL